MDYTELNISFKIGNEGFLEIITAELADLPFDSFVQEHLVLKAYIPKQEWPPSMAAINSILDKYNEVIASHAIVEIPHQNWNAIWESGYDPVFIGEDVMIKAPFHSNADERKYTIVIEPNMSFGTGHHPTTELMINAMQNLPLDQKDVCDFGCGSGVLSIFAALRGANGLGIEIDEEAAKAAQKNIELNRIESFRILQGDLEILQKSNFTFDIILANINRNVIEESVTTFYEKTRTGAFLICAGFLDTDAPALIVHLEKYGFGLVSSQSKEGWTMLLTKRL